MNRPLRSRRTRVGLRSGVVAGAVAIGMAAGPGQATAQIAAPYPPANCATVKAGVSLVKPNIVSKASWALGPCKIAAQPVAMQVTLQSRMNRGPASPLPWNNVKSKTFTKVPPGKDVSFDTLCRPFGSPNGYEYRVSASIGRPLPFGGFFPLPPGPAMSKPIVAQCKV